jgi:phosphoglycerate dehydrogenase-like enzyme
MNPSALLLHPLPPDWLSSLDGRVRLVVNAEGDTEIHHKIFDVDGVLSLLTDRIDDEFLDRTPNLRVVSNMAAGVDNIDLQACTKRKIPVGNTPGAMTEATADLTFALLLAAARKLPESSRDALEGRWHTWTPTGWLGADLNGSTLGIVGLGKIGKAVAKRAKGFGIKTIYWEPERKIEEEYELEVRYVPFEELVKTSDFITLHCPLNDSTRGLINEPVLRMMKPSAILVNASRGPVVDTGSLVLALSENWITSAALDVTDPEPLPPEHPLYTLPNCIILPHIGSATYGTRKRMAEMACENLLAGLEGKPLPNCANPEVY